jgi:hypothetical protein
MTSRKLIYRLKRAFKIKVTLKKITVTWLIGEAIVIPCEVEQ